MSNDKQKQFVSQLKLLQSLHEKAINFYEMAITRLNNEHTIHELKQTRALHQHALMLIAQALSDQPSSNGFLSFKEKEFFLILKEAKKSIIRSRQAYALSAIKYSKNQEQVFEQQLEEVEDLILHTSEELIKKMASLASKDIAEELCHDALKSHNSIKDLRDQNAK